MKLSWRDMAHLKSVIDEGKADARKRGGMFPGSPSFIDDADWSEIQAAVHRSGVRPGDEMAKYRLELDRLACHHFCHLVLELERLYSLVNEIDRELN